MAGSPDKAVARAPTIREAADYAKVSPKTVSRVLNKHPYIREDTRLRVEEGIKALGFQPNIFARVLAGGSAGMKIALLHSFPNPGVLGSLLVDLIDQAAEAHAGLVVRQVDRPENHLIIADELASLDVKGVILTQPLSEQESLITDLRSKKMAVVAIGIVSDGARLSSVGINDVEAARSITKHLIDLGHRRIGFVKGHTAVPASRRRYLGYETALRQADLEIDPLLIMQGTSDYQSGLEAAHQLLSNGSRPTAVFASNDDMAAAVTAVAHEHGLNVPHDLSIAGFDDSVLATAISPSLTTIRRPTREITRMAFDLLQQERFSRVDPDREFERVMVKHELAQRASTANPRLCTA